MGKICKFFISFRLVTVEKQNRRKKNHLNVPWCELSFVLFCFCFSLPNRNVLSSTHLRELVKSLQFDYIFLPPVLTTSISIFIISDTRAATFCPNFVQIHVVCLTYHHKFMLVTKFYVLTFVYYMASERVKCNQIGAENCSSVVYIVLDDTVKVIEQLRRLWHLLNILLLLLSMCEDL